MLHYTIDRIEGDTAVLESDDGEVINIKLTDLPAGIKEGDILKFENNIYTIDEQRTKQGKKDIEERFNKLFLN